MVFSLDKIDRKILAKLCENARISHKEIASSCRIAKSTVTFRIARLKEQGVIRSYQTLIDHQILGTLYNRLIVKTSADLDEQKVRRYISKNPHIPWAAKTYGKGDWAIVLTAKSLVEVESQIAKLHKQMGKYITKQHCSFAYKIYHCAANVLFEHSFITPIAIEYSNSPSVIPSFHKKLLHALVEDPLRSIVDLANQLQVNTKKVLQVKRELERQGIIKRYSIDIDFASLDLETHHVRWNFQSFDPLVYERCKEHLLTLPQTLYVTQVLGGTLESEFVVANQRELFELLEQIRQSFSPQLNFSQDLLIYDIIKNLA